ncbi:remorin 4.2 isoform X2 [Rhododendron vialii]|uniref:remorin 4.2 isoform X2 n=1 Tax=Rhododendron vialii TaxID=182163 RepID=UPI00265E9851|nr:remorin 4.2 isoform X2 [Rhododendron vialii]
MRSIEDKGCLNIAPVQENSGKFEFHKGNTPNRGFGKPAPSKWDDAQKWLVNLSRGPEPKSERPRDSNADDRRLIAPVPKNDDYSSGGEDVNGMQFEGETKNVDCEEPVWRVNKRNPNAAVVRSICVRDMGTEMTPIASQEPSRNGTPIRIMSPNRSPSSSESSTPVRTLERVVESSRGNGVAAAEGRGEGGRGSGGGGSTFDEFRGSPAKNSEQVEKGNSALEIRAAAWDEAERAKYTARFKQEEVKIQAWENHEKRKAEMEMRRMEVKAERLKARAQERLANKLAATRRIAEEKLANAEAKLNEQAVRTSERADYIRRTGRLPSSFSFKLPSCCW